MSDNTVSHGAPYATDNNINDFTSLNLDKRLTDALKAQNIITPTDIQKSSYTAILEGRDVIAQSHTGSGKTLAYLLPLFEKILDNNISGNYAIILAPTYELAVQIKRQVELIDKNIDYSVESALIIGDVNINRQIEALKSKPQIIIGTAGRIYELIKKKKIAAHLVKYLVIDEADKLLDKNNFDITASVRKCLMKDAQTVLFSASITKETKKVSISLLCNPLEIHIKNEQKYAANIEHIFVVENRDKLEMLRKVLHNLRPDKALIFINKVFDIELATSKLQFNNFNAACIHGSNSKAERKNILNDFKNGKLKALISTDIAARGLQIDGINIVVSISMPEASSDYLHRAGRCGRNGNKGKSICIINDYERKLIADYEKHLGIKFKEMKFVKGKLVNVNKSKDIAK